MPILLIVLELFVGTLAVWVLTFEVALYGRMSVNNLGVVFGVSWILLLLVIAKPCLRRIRVVNRQELAFARNILALGCLVGLLVLVLSRPDADDFSYFQQPMIDAATSDSPFTVAPFYIPFSGKRVEFPFLAENEAWEAMVATMAHLANVDPLLAYHNIFAFLATVLWVITYALLFRRFRIPRNRVWLALTITVIFLLLDGNLHRSFGNFTLLRIWQGKIIAWSILPSLFLLFTLRYFASPSRYRFCLIFLIGSLSYFLNRSTIFLFAVLGTSYAITYLLIFYKNSRRSHRAMAAIAVVIPLWVFGAGLAIYLLPNGISLESIFTENSGSGRQFGTSWWTSLRNTVIGSPMTLARDVLFLIILPLLAVPRPLNRLLPTASLTIAALALSPLSGPLWYYFFSNVYWRFYYALPLPLCVGLAAHLVSPSGSSRLKPLNRLILGATLVVVTGLNVQRPAASAANQVEFKHPLEYRFHGETLRFAREVAPRLKGKTVLAPKQMAIILGMTEYDTIQLSYIRSTPMGSNKYKANLAIEKCHVGRRTITAVQAMLNQGAEAVIMAECGEEGVNRLHRFLSDHRLVEKNVVADGFRLFEVVAKKKP